MADLTPMFRQYLAIKEKHPSAILLFRMGDFYELFFEDAKIASRELDLALTTRDRGKKNPIPMAGFPHHALKNYLAKLIERGYKVAVCDQIEDPRIARGIVKRAVTQVVTPGTYNDPDNLPAKQNRYLAAVSHSSDENRFGAAFLDFSTGEFAAGNLHNLSELVDSLSRFSPSEILIPENGELEKFIKKNFNGIITTYLHLDDFNSDNHKEKLEKLLPPHNPLAPQTPREKTALAAASAILSYLSKTQNGIPPHIDRLAPLPGREFLILDETAQRNLELFKTIGDGGRPGSLFAIIDETLTAPGGRMLAAWLSAPLADSGKIEERLDGVSFFFERVGLRDSIRELLKGAPDLERLTSQVATERATPRQIIALSDALKRFFQIKEILDNEPLLPQFISAAFSQDAPPQALIQMIDKAIVETPPLLITEGGIFKRNYSAALDELIELAENGDKKIRSMEEGERKKTGIASLKINYNRVFGYYIEVTKSNLHLVPESYIRRQTTVNGERFITHELKEIEDKVLNASEKRRALEFEEFKRLRATIADFSGKLRNAAAALALADVICALAETAQKRRYTRPLITDGPEIIIKAGRHPVVETLQKTEPFAPNDTYLSSQNARLLIITGPNMAGKSTYLRQTALIVILAQIGSFVPAESAEIGLCDRIFTRVGAADNLTRGQSTFMVEMNETAAILKNATNRSLVILDEIGRGTSTYDGLAIAWAVADYLYSNIACRTLFATHYHELTEFAEEKPLAKNYHISAREWNDTVVFIRTLKEGPANRSYGIEVAKLAGLPARVTDRAAEILSRLEQDEFTGRNREKLTGKSPPPGQLQLFIPVPLPSEAEKLLRETDIDSLTPKAALELLYRLKDKLK